MEHLLRVVPIKKNKKKQPSVQYCPRTADNVWLLIVQLRHFSKCSLQGQADIVRLH